MLLNFISVYLFITVMLSVFLAAYVQSRSGSSYTRTMLFLCLAVSFYMYGYSAEISSTTFEQALFWNRFQYIGIPFVSALWFTIALMYTGRINVRKRWLIGFIYLIPVMTFLLRFTNDWHHLYFASISYRRLGERLLLIREYGIGTYIQMVHSSFMVIASMVIYLHEFTRKKEQEHTKIHLMVLASFFVILGLILNVINPAKLYIEFVVLFLPITCIVVIIAIMRYDFLEVKSMARNMVFENSTDAMLLLNHTSKVVDYNSAADDLFSQLGISLRETDLATLLVDHEAFYEAMNSESFEHFQLTFNDEHNHYEVSTQHIHNDSGVKHGLLKSIRNITQTHRLNENLLREATTDELSGLLNRREFMRMGNEAVKAKQSKDEEIHLLMLDIDYFKRINDNYGHIAGDKVISIFGRILVQNFREDDVVARLGGEEFGVILRGAPSAAAYRKAEDFRRRISSHIHRENDEAFNITVSIGLAKMTEAMGSLDELLGCADKALYMSKENGRNQVTYYKKSETTQEGSTEGYGGQL